MRYRPHRKTVDVWVRKIGHSMKLGHCGIILFLVIWGISNCAICWWLCNLPNEGFVSLISVASFTKEVNLYLAKRPLKTNGHLANRKLTPLVKEVTGRVLCVLSQYFRETSLPHEGFLTVPSSGGCVTFPCNEGVVSIIPVVSFTKEVNPRLAKCPLKTNGHLANHGLTSLVKEVTGRVLRVLSQYCRETWMGITPWGLKSIIPGRTGVIYIRKTLWNGNIFRITGPLCGEFTGHWWIPCTNASDVELWCFLLSVPWINGWVNNREAGDLRCHRAHYDVTVMYMLGVNLTIAVSVGGLAPDGAGPSVGTVMTVYLYMLSL